MVAADSELALDGISGSSIELCAEMTAPEAAQYGVKVCRSAGGEEKTLVCFGRRRVTDAAVWQEIRRPEVFDSLAAIIYDRTPPIPTHLRFETTDIDAEALGGLAGGCRVPSPCVRQGQGGPGAPRSAPRRPPA
ncbi:MAG: hypothetical protein KJZ87_10550 [Thermoguttaceae bacterium]|nr:hypothetical protein [Thermoguttaceae bacterium]